MTWWAKVISTITGQTVGEVLEYKAEKKRLQHERQLEKLRGKIAYEKAKSDRAAASEGYDADWELAQIKNSGWKDEFTLIVLSIPMIGVFIPWLQPFIKQGFADLATTPEWYRWLVIMIYAATWGIRVWRRKSTIA